MRCASGVVLLADANASVHSLDALDIEHAVPFKNFLSDNSIRITDPDDCVNTFDSGGLSPHQIDYIGVSGSVSAIVGTTHSIDGIGPIVECPDHFPIAATVFFRSKS